MQEAIYIRTNVTLLQKKEFQIAFNRPVLILNKLLNKISQVFNFLDSNCFVLDKVGLLAKLKSSSSDNIKGKNMKKNENTDRLEMPSRLVNDTNLDTAYFRSFSDIPNAKRLSDLVEAEAAFKHGTFGTFDEVKSLIPSIEARYKSLDALIKLSGVRQVVEFAAGRTTRGMNNPQWNYIHTEQDKDALEQMKEITKLILKKDAKNIHFVKFDAITGEGIEDVMMNLRDEKIAVVHEGLFHYYPIETKMKIAVNAKLLLEKYGGVYITPDTSTKERKKMLQKTHPNIMKQSKKRDKKIGRDLSLFEFESAKEAYNLFKKLGFNIETYHFGDFGIRLNSLELLFPDKKVRKSKEEVIMSRELWQFTL